MKERKPHVRVHEPKRNRDKIPEGTLALLRLTSLQYALMESESDDGRKRMTLVQSPQKGLALFAMSSEELEAWFKMMTLCYRLAKPMVAEYERKAREAYERGDDLDIRLYRQIPVFAVRNRAIEEYGASLPGGLDGSVDLDGFDTFWQWFEAMAGTRSPGRNLPDDVPSGVEAGDDAAEADGVPSVGEVGGEPELPG